MKLSDLKFSYPEELIALVPSRPTRVMYVDQNDNQNHDQHTAIEGSEAGRIPQEISIEELIKKIPPGDILVINDTKVLKRRIFTNNGLEVLFLDQDENKNWNVLFPSKKIKIGDEIILPNQSRMVLLEKGLPQKVKVIPDLSDMDFDEYAELPLPPYIQQARNERHNVVNDDQWYQTAWAEKAGSFAAPTASLHFSEENINQLKKNGVQILKITLHVGLGTFLPVKTEDLDQHKMHAEVYHVDQDVWNKIIQAKKNNRGVWAMGTTVTRTLETIAQTHKLSGESKILLQVGSDFKIVNRLLTNFHQPESTLLALVAGFSSLENVKKCYEWAIENKFKLFSYGDLSVWIK